MMKYLEWARKSDKRKGTLYEPEFTPLQFESFSRAKVSISFV